MIRYGFIYKESSNRYLDAEYSKKLGAKKSNKLRLTLSLNMILTADLHPTYIRRCIFGTKAANVVGKHLNKSLLRVSTTSAGVEHPSKFFI